MADAYKGHFKSNASYLKTNQFLLYKFIIHIVEMYSVQEQNATF
jgi:hypothetical protein